MWTEIIYHTVTKGPYANTLMVFPELHSCTSGIHVNEVP